MLTRQTTKTGSPPMNKVPVLLQAVLYVFLLLTTSTSLTAAEAVSATHVRSFDGLLDPVDEELVTKYINEFVKHQQSTEQLLERGILYFPLIEKELINQGMPDAIKVLPFVESRFDPMAVSRVGAAGMWQFMVPTARQMGLRINRYVDERRDPAKATRAAVAYLQYLYSRYEDWSLAFAAYNAGPGRVNRAIRMAGGETSFKAIKRFLPRETQKYIPKYIAAQYIMEHYDEYGFAPEAPELDLQWTGHIHVSEYMTIEEISKVVGVSEDVIHALNPSLRRKFVPTLSTGYDLVLPARVLPTFEYYLATNESMPNPYVYRTIELVVERGQSVFEVAEHLRLDPFLLKAWNRLESNHLEEGQTIIVHEMYDPSQPRVEEIRAEPVDRLLPLPAKIDPENLFRQEYLRILEIQEEEMNWDLHQASF